MAGKFEPSGQKLSEGDLSKLMTLNIPLTRMSVL